MPSPNRQSRQARVAEQHKLIRDKYYAELNSLNEGSIASRMDIALERVMKIYPAYSRGYMLRLLREQDAPSQPQPEN